MRSLWTPYCRSEGWIHRHVLCDQVNLLDQNQSDCGIGPSNPLEAVNISSSKEHSFHAFAHLNPSWAVRIREAFGWLASGVFRCAGVGLKQPWKSVVVNLILRSSDK